MKKTMPIVLAIWPYMLIGGYVLFVNPNIDNNPDVFKYFLCIYLIGSVIINVLSIMSAFSEKEDYKRLAFIDMILKLIHIPIYILVAFIILMGGLVLAITGIGLILMPVLIFIAFIIDYFLLLTTSSFGFNSIRLAKKNSIISSKQAVIYTILHLLFVFDVINAIVLYVKIRKATKVPEE